MAALSELAVRKLFTEQAEEIPHVADAEGLPPTNPGLLEFAGTFHAA